MAAVVWRVSNRHTVRCTAVRFTHKRFVDFHRESDRIFVLRFVSIWIFSSRCVYRRRGRYGFFVTIAILQLWLFIGGDTDDNPYRHLRSVRVRSLWLKCLVFVSVCLILCDQFSTRYCHHSHLGPVTMYVDLTWTRTQSLTTVHWTTSNIDDECVFWFFLTVDCNICNSYLLDAQLLVNESFSSWLKFEIIPLNIDYGIICPVRNQLNCTLLSVVYVAHLSRSRSAVLTLNIFVTLFNVNTCWIVCNLA